MPKPGPDPAKLTEANLKKLSEPAAKQTSDNPGPTMSGSAASTSSSPSINTHPTIAARRRSPPRRRPPGRKEPPQLPPPSSYGSSNTSVHSYAGSTASDASSFWGRVTNRASSYAESHSSYEDEIHIHHRNRPNTRVRRPSVSSNFSFPRMTREIPSVPGAAQTAFLRALGLYDRKGPVLVLMRHCQSESNGGTRNGQAIPEEDRRYFKDPPLSDQGKTQASKLKVQYPLLIDNIRQAGGKVLISHLLRAKQTGFFGFPELLDKCKSLVEIRPELQEMFGGINDTGKSAVEQEAEYPGFDYSKCTPEVNVKKGIHASKARSICANAILKDLKARPEPILLLITHGHTIIELLQNRHWKQDEKYMEYQRNGVATVFAFQNDTTKLRPVSKHYAAKILGRPASGRK